VKDAKAVYVVDERFEQRYFPGRSALDGHFTFGGRRRRTATGP
jgi:uncharacterized protein involved in tellurium resistance